MRKRKGFTLVELVVVIAVIAILAAVLIPTFSFMIEKAQHSALISNGRNAYKNLLIELGEHRDCFYQEDGYYIVFGEGGKINELGKHNGTRFKKDAQGIYVLVDENTIRCNEVEIRSIQSILYELAGHIKATEWSKNSTHHWYECQKEDCEEKFNYVEHNFALEVAEEAYLASKATCTKKTTYFKSCECGEMSAETFEYGDVIGHIKATEWSKNSTHHWYECQKEDCEEKFDEAEHSFDGIVCNVCDYEKPATEGLKYELNADGQSYYVKGIGTATATEIIIPSSYKGMHVTGIGNYAFDGCSSLASVYIPNSVTSIGNYAFNACSSIANIMIGNGVTIIGERAFYECSSLKSITIPNSVTSIGNNAFYGCSSLNGVYITDLEAWCKISFGEIFSNSLYYAKNLYLNNQLLTNLVIPDSVTSIGSSAFSYCSSLTSVDIPNSVTAMGNLVFLHCSNLASITIPNSVISIGYKAFEGCSSLTSITIPDSVKGIGGDAFGGCSSLKSITLSRNLNRITYNMFYNCSSLTSITIPDSVDGIDNGAFKGCSSLTSIEIPNSAKFIGYSAFSGCSNLASITIPNSVTRIEYKAFYDCSSLTSIEIPDSVTSIENYTFSGCSSLASIEIPNSVTSIGEYAFRNCSSLTSITIGSSVTSIGDYAFFYCTNLTIYCEAASKPSGWDVNWNYSNCTVVWGYKNEN